MAVSPVAVLGGVLLDVVESDEPQHAYEITDKPVEVGENISDHMKAEPVILSVSGVIVGDDAWPRLKRLQQYQMNKKLITYTNRVMYTNMAVQEISTSHNGSIANGFRFSITLKRVKLAEPKEIQLADVPPAVATKAKETKNAGTKQAVPTGKKKSEEKTAGGIINTKDTDEKLADKIRNFKSE